MPYFPRTLTFLIIAIVWGCAPAPQKAPVAPPIPEKPVHPLFLGAEKAYDNGQYNEALNGYTAFLREAYEDPSADAALMKIGKIFQHSGREDDALAVFARLAREFPQSVFIDDAVLETLRIHYERNEYETVVNIGLAHMKSADPKMPRSAFYTIIADAYEAMNANLETAQYRYQALVNATDEERPAAWKNLQKSVEQLNAEEIHDLVAQVTDQRAMGFLLYRLGLALIMEEKYDDAMDVLDVFVEQFPSHPDHQDAADMILSMKERDRFSPFTVGCVLPLSGSYGLFGKRALEGIEFAVHQIGKISDGIPFQIVVKDSRSDPESSAIAVESLDQEKVGAILGPMATSDAAAVMAQKRGIPAIVFTQKDGVTEIGPYVLRNFITPQMQVQALVSFAVIELGINRFAILYPDEHYGKRYMNLFWDQVVDHGRVINGVEAYNPAGTDFATPIKKLAGIYYDMPKDLMVDSLPKSVMSPSFLDSDDGVASNHPVIDIDPLEALTGIPLDREIIDALGRRNVEDEDQWHPIVDFDAIFIPDAPKKAGLVIPQLAYYDIQDVFLLGTNLWNSQTLLDMSGEYMKSTLIVDGFFAQSQDERVKAFVDGFRLVYGRAPGIIEAVAYDTTMMVFQTMRQTATDSRRAVKQALLNVSDFDGVTGRTRFTADGEAQKTMKMLRIQRGHFVEANRLVEPSPAGVNALH